MPFGIVDFIRNRIQNQRGASPPPVAPPPTARPTPGVRMPGINLGGPVSSVLGGNIGGGYEAARGGGNLESARPRRNRRGGRGRRRGGGVRGNRGRRRNNTQERYMAAAPEPNVNYQNGMRRMRNRLSMF